MSSNHYSSQGKSRQLEISEEEVPEWMLTPVNPTTNIDEVAASHA